MCEILIKFLILKTEQLSEDIKGKLNEEDSEYFMTWLKTTFDHVHRLLKDKQNEHILLSLFAQFLSLSFDKFPNIGLYILSQLDHDEKFSSKYLINIINLVEEAKIESENEMNITTF